MEETNKILLNKFRSFNSVNENSSIDISLSNTNKPIPLNDISETVNQYVQFLKERQGSSKYRVYGVISPLVNNPLFNENIKIYKNNSGNIVSKNIVSTEIFEKDGWIGFYNDEIDTTSLEYNDNKSSLCQFIPFDPGYERLKMLDNDGIPNYLLRITYPFRNKDIKIINNGLGITLKDGIPIIEKFIVNINGRNYTGFKTAFNHGLTENSNINFYNFIDNTSDNRLKLNQTYRIFKLGNQTNGNKYRTFVVDIEPDFISFNIGVSTIKRVVNGKPSKYYVREFKTLTSSDYKDYDLYPSAFGKTYFSDNLVAYNFKKDIDVENLTDNLNRPLSEIYLTIIKNDNDADITNINSKYWLEKQKNLPSPYNNRFWTKISAGYDFENNENINYNIRAYGDSNYINNNLWYENIDETDDIFDGDIVEYNDNEFNERTIEIVYHRINTVYREFYSKLNTSQNDKKEGYIYSPFSKIQIREFSNYIHPTVDLGSIIKKYNITNNEEIIELKKSFKIPEYATEISDNVYKWRDLLDIGETDSTGNGIEYPFESGAHYVYLNNRFFLQRQDPPCDYNIVSEDFSLGATDYNNESRDKFKKYINDPTFLSFDFIGQDNDIYNKLTDGGVTDISNYNGIPNIEISVNLGEYIGEYELGKRDIAGGCIDFSVLEQKNLDDVC